MPEVLVLNASPVIFLAKAGRLDLLRLPGTRRVVVPDPVVREVTDAGYDDAPARALAETPWIEHGGSPAVPEEILAWDLGPGESSVIALARQVSGAAVLDDRLGRKCALALGVPVMGTVGIVVAAQRTGMVADARAVLLELRAVGMWLSDEVIARALRVAGLDSRR